MRYWLFLTALSAGSLFAADISVIDEIICKANGDIITRNDYQRARKQIEDGLRQQGLNGPRLEDALKDAGKNILRERIDQLLLISKAKEMNLNVDTEVNKQLAEIQRNIKIADPEKFQQFVREQTGQSYEDYKAELKNQLLTQRVVRQEVSSKIQFKREDLMKILRGAQGRISAERACVPAGDSGGDRRQGRNWAGRRGEEGQGRSGARQEG